MPQDESTGPPADHDGLDKTVAQMVDAVQVLCVNLVSRFGSVCSSSRRQISPNDGLSVCAGIGGRGGEPQEQANGGCARIVDFDHDYEKVIGESEVQAFAFRRSLAKDISASLSIEPDRVHVIDVQPGSIKATVEIAAAGPGQPPASLRACPCCTGRRRVEPTSPASQFRHLCML